MGIDWFVGSDVRCVRGGVIPPPAAGALQWRRGGDQEQVAICGKDHAGVVAGEGVVNLMRIPAWRPAPVAPVDRPGPVVAEVLRRAHGLRDGRVPSVGADDELRVQPLLAASPPSYLYAPDAPTRSAHHVGHPALRQQNGAGVDRGLLEERVERLAPQAVGRTPLAIRQQDLAAVEAQAQRVQAGRSRSNGVTDAEGVKLIHARRLDQVRRRHLVARQPRRVQERYRQSGVREALRQRGPRAAGPHDHDVELSAPFAAAHLRQAILTLRLAWIGSRSSSRNGTPRP
jgi:hypothetical protein